MLTSLHTTTGLLEAPLLADDGDIVFSDVTGGGVFRYRAGQVETVVPARRGIGGLVWHRDGGLVMSGRDLRYHDEHGSRPITTIENVAGFNDLTAGPDGSLYAGVLRHYPGRGEQAGPSEVIRIDPHGLTSTAVEGVRWPNGLAFTPDGEALYVCEYAESRVLIVRDGEREVFAHAPTGECDGLAVDIEGGVWVALGSGGAVARFTPDGRLDTTVTIPGAFTSSVAFHGTDLIVTAAGELVSVPVGIAGVPVAVTEIPIPRG